MKKVCDRCGSINHKMEKTGSATLCQSCSIKTQHEINILRNDGMPVNAIQIARKHFKEKYSGGTYLLRDIPKKIKQAMKTRALKDGCNQRDVILSALVEYLNS